MHEVSGILVFTALFTIAAWEHKLGTVQGFMVFLFLHHSLPHTFWGLLCIPSLVIDESYRRVENIYYIGIT